MNWYKFKVELFSWMGTTALAVLTTVATMGMLTPLPEGARRSYPVSLRLMAENEAVVPYIFLLLLAFMWVCRWRALRIFRADTRYGER